MEYVKQFTGYLVFGNEKQRKIIKKIESDGIDYVAHMLYQHETWWKYISKQSFEKRLAKMPTRDAVRWPAKKRYYTDKTPKGIEIRQNFKV